MNARRLAPLLPLLLLPLLLAPLSAGADGDDVVRGILLAIRSARASAGVAAVSEPAGASRAARARAQEAARLPESRRLASASPVLGVLRRQGLARVSHVREYLQEQSGYGDPAAFAVEQFRDHPLWRTALDPATTAVGVGTARAADGALLVDVLLLEQPPVRDLRAMEAEVETAINRVRARHGRDPLVPTGTLAGVARAHSQDMVRRDYFDHADPDGRKPADRVGEAGVAWTRVTENIAMNMGMDDPVSRAVEGWMDSPGHRANILDAEVTHTGVGLAERDDGGYVFTQVFVALKPAR
jgi:uncharacterized protein YkwD